MDHRDLQGLQARLDLPTSGRIDFKTVLGASFNQALSRFGKGHFPMPRKTVHRISFDEPFVSTSSAASMVIDNLYQADQAVRFQPCLHTYDWATQASGFEPMQPRAIDSDPTRWEAPHVFAVHDSASPRFRFSTSQPNSLNVGFGGGSFLSQLMDNRHAVRINFDKPACAVQINSDYRIHHEDQGKPIWNWPQLLAYNADGQLLDQDEAPYGGLLCVSSWADDIAYVMVTVNNHCAGVEPFGIFDDLAWTSLEFVLRCAKKLQAALQPVPRGALIDQVGHRLAELQTTQRRLQRHLAKLDDATLATQLQADLAELQQQTESLQRFYSQATQDTVNAVAHAPARAAVPAV